MKQKGPVFDDNKNNLMLEKDILEAAGFEVFEAEAAGILRQDKETFNIPIIFVTASVMPEDVELLKDISHTGFTGKPINTRVFVTEIRRYLHPDS